MKKHKTDSIKIIFKFLKLIFSNVAMSQPCEATNVVSFHSLGTQDNSWSSNALNPP